jgi:nucleoside-diphosphate-sugar epimerase
MGSLGSDVVEAYHNKHELLIVDDLLESATKKEELPEKVMFIQANVAEDKTILAALTEFRPDLVIYLAATLSSDQNRALQSVIGLSNVIGAAHSGNSFAIIYIQSFLTREVESPITAESRYHTRDAYGTWKLASELLLKTYSGKKMTLILSNVLSPSLSIGAVPTFARKILNSESFSVTDTFRDYLSPCDFISFLDAAIVHDVWPETVVVGSGKSVSTLELALKIREILGANLDSNPIDLLEPKVSDPKNVEFDVSNTVLRFAWRPNSNIDGALKICVDRVKLSNGLIRQHH